MILPSQERVADALCLLVCIDTWPKEADFIVARLAVPMKTGISKGARWAAIGLFAATLSSSKMAGQDSANTVSTLNSAGTAPTTETAPVQLSVGVWDVLKLVRSHVEQGTIVAFVNNSDQNYHLGVPELLYLREQGVPEAVLTAMQNKAPIPAALAPSVWAALGQPTDSSAAAPPPAVTSAPAAASSIATAAAYVQPSTVYVAPPAPTYRYYYPDYGYYPGYYYPPVSLSLGFGFGFGSFYGSHGCYSGHGYYGGHGGYHGGGSYGGRHH